MMRVAIALLLLAVAAGAQTQGTISGGAGVSTSSAGPPPLQIAPGQTLANGNVGTPYSQLLRVSGGTPPYSSTITSGSLPAGITLGPTNITGAQFSGTPTTGGGSSFTVEVCDSASPTPACVSQAQSILVTVGAQPFSIPTQSCPQGISSAAYTCNVRATGGTTPYTWVVSSGTLPPGTTLSTSQNQAVISGTSTSTGTSSFTLQATDSSGPALTATISLSITIVAASSCGFNASPRYGCARSDWNTFALDPTTSVPPTAGANSPGSGVGLHDCLPGDTSSGLPSCGNAYGINTIITELAYNNVQILRVSDYNDIAECGLAQVGGGGNAGQNVFDTSGQYFRAGYCLKWLDTANFQINTCAHRGLTSNCSPAGYVQNANGTVFNAGAPTILGSYITPGKFYYFPGPSQIQALTVTNGVAGTPSVVVDLIYGVPCWTDVSTMVSSIPFCGNWQASYSYPPGSTVCPGCGSGSVPANNSGRCQPGNATPLCYHSFALLNNLDPAAAALGPSPCVSGATEPNWNSALATPTVGWLVVVPDGTCEWADMGPPVFQVGAKVNWGATAFVDITDNWFDRAMNNWGSQDGPGACFGVVYDLAGNVFHHYNTCTGNIYTITCSGGTGYQCTGGTRTLTYIGDIYSSTRITSKDYRRVQLHSFDMGQSGAWIQPTHNSCALKDTSGNWVLCVAPTGPSTPGSNVNVWYWYPQGGVNQNIDSYSLLGTATPGHTILGYDVYGWSGVNSTVMTHYVGVNMTNPTLNTGTGLAPIPGLPGNSQQCTGLLPSGFYGCFVGWFNLTPNLPNPAIGYPSAGPYTGNDCSPSPCAGSAAGRPGYSATNMSLITWVSWDQHTSWVTNRGGDANSATSMPICMEAYAGRGGPWPWTFPWVGEVTCWATDKSNRITRQAQTYNTLTESNMIPPGTTASAALFNSATMIGQYSQDGNWWTFNSNWFCTLGSRIVAATAALCGWPFQLNHAYQVGELVGPTWQQNAGNGGAHVGTIYQVTTAGTTSQYLPCPYATSTGTNCPNIAVSGYWCAVNAAATPGCTFTNGGVTFKYMGASNELVSIFLVKLQ